MASPSLATRSHLGSSFLAERPLRLVRARARPSLHAGPVRGRAKCYDELFGLRRPVRRVVCISVHSRALVCPLASISAH
eukprot:3378220-Pyramimonas_sp.AAC.1